MRPNNAGTASRKICEICRSKRPNQRKDGLQSTHNLEQKRKTCGFLLSLFYKCRIILYAEDPRLINRENKTQLRSKRNWVSIIRHKIQFASLSDKDITHLVCVFFCPYGNRKAVKKTVQWHCAIWDDREKAPLCNGPGQLLLAYGQFTF